MELDSETWPFLQHFVRLLTDPFIYIRRMDFVSRNELLNLLTEAMNPELGRLHCEQMHFYLEDNVQKSMNFTKNHVRCDDFQIWNNSSSTHDKEFLDFIVNGGYCTSAIDVRNCHLPNITVDLVQKFMGLKNCDEYQLVDSIRYNTDDQLPEVLKRNYAKFIVEEESDNRCIAQIFEFANNDIRKKLRLSTRTIEDYCIPDPGFDFDPPISNRSDSPILMSTYTEVKLEFIEG
ncbi:hypothetical protein DdX_13778 [Ditylenchus destructor]|uniref:Uncharacterized protein n=1 Tax=Ditylenchus destructor TaxID=166010 RepID=A0AAD4MY01_9BILA|nr:hypothetical protein DdX_13778 [Ditylenchus destructor]